MENGGDIELSQNFESLERKFEKYKTGKINWVPLSFNCTTC